MVGFFHLPWPRLALITASQTFLLYSVFGLALVKFVGSTMYLIGELGGALSGTTKLTPPRSFQVSSSLVRYDFPSASPSNAG